MSQFFLNAQGTPPGTPGIAFETGNTGGPVGPDAGNNLNVLGDSGSNLTVTGNAGTNTLTISSTNVLNGTGTTVGVTTADIITFALGATPSTYKFRFELVAFDSVTPLGAGYQINATLRTTGAAGTVIEIPDGDGDEEGILSTDDWEVLASGNNAVLRVTGVVGLTINWKAQGYYISVS